MSEIFIGANTAANVYLGSELAGAVYLGGEKVWPATVVTPPSGGGTQISRIKGSQHWGWGAQEFSRTPAITVAHSPGDLLLLSVSNTMGFTPCQQTAADGWVYLGDTPGGGTDAAILYKVSGTGANTLGTWNGTSMNAASLLVLPAGFTTPAQDDCKVAFSDFDAATSVNSPGMPNVSGGHPLVLDYIHSGVSTTYYLPKAHPDTVTLIPQTETAATYGGWWFVRNDPTTSPPLTYGVSDGTGQGWVAATVEIDYP